jgi:hypothetical protein
VFREVQEALMFHRYLGFVAVVVGLSLTADLGAQKGGKPKPVDKIATATFRCSGPTAATHEPPGIPCGPSATWGVPDGITGDGNSYVGIGDGPWYPNTGAFLRSDGELEVIVRPAGGRFVFLNFESVLQPPGSTARKTFDFADLENFDLTSNVINPATNDLAANGALSIPIGVTWPTRVKGTWNDPYGVGWAIRFNPPGYPGSTHAHVTRNSENSWTWFATDVDIARLVSPGIRHQGPRNEGWYRMPFEITITVP